MYCSIIQEQMKRKPRQPYIYKNPVWEASWPGSERFVLAGDQVVREPREKWRILLKQSERVDGKAIKRQWHVVTVDYWRIVDDFLLQVNSDLEYSEYNDEYLWDRLEKTFPSMEIKYLWDLVQAKLAPIVVTVISEYKSSSEYQVFCLNKQMKDERNAAEAENAREKAKRKAEEDERARQRSYRYSSNSHSTGNGSASQFDLSSDEKQMATSLLNEGYRKLALKHHPDAGGTHKDMVLLNNLKEKLMCGLL